MLWLLAALVLHYTCVLAYLFGTFHPHLDYTYRLNIYTLVNERDHGLFTQV